MKRLTGTLKAVSEHLWYIETADEIMYELEAGDWDLRPNEYVAVTIEEREGDGPCRILALDYLPAPAAAFNTTEKRIGFFRKIRPDASEVTIEKKMVVASEWAWEMEKFWKHYGRHKWEVEVRAYPLLEDCSAVTPEFCRTAIRRFMWGPDMDDFKPVYHHTHDRYANGQYCGLAYISDVWGATYEGCTVKTAIHEIGHNFGLRHSNTEEVEYGDVTSVMGKSQTITGLISPNLFSLGLVDDRDWIKVDETRQILLAPMEMSSLALLPQEHRHAKVYVAGKPTYYLSIRKDKGWPYHPGKHKGNRLYIHYKQPDGKTVLEETLQPGNEALLRNNSKVKYINYQNESALVDVIINPNDPVEPLQRPSSPGAGIPAALATARISEEDRGLWYDPDFSGQGFDLQVRDGRLTLCWYTYNQANDSRRWYIATGDIGPDGAPPKMDLYSAENGTFQDPASRRLYHAGWCQIGVVDGLATFQYETPEHGRGAMTLQKLMHSASPLSGLWYSPDQAGAGFSAQFRGDEIVAYWYTYGKNPYYPGHPHHGYNNTQRWFMCQGTLGPDNRTFDMLVYEVRGGRWMDFDPVLAVPVGEATWGIVSDALVEFQYEIAADSSTTGSGRELLARLF